MQRWTIQLDGCPRRVNHAAVAYGDLIFSFGGYCTGDDYKVSKPMDVHRLNTASYRWTVLPIPSPNCPWYNQIPYQRYGHTAVQYMDSAYIFGGRNDGIGACNTLYEYDLRKQRWHIIEHQGLKPGIRDGHSACLFHSKMYIFGGFVESVKRFANDIHYMDFITMTWTQVKTTGIPARYRDFHSATPIGNVMWVFGGRSDMGGSQHTGKDVYDPNIVAFDVLTNTWHMPGRSHSTPPIGRRSHSAFEYKNELYIFGGYNGEYNQHYRDMHKYNPMTNEWTPFRIKGFGPCARRRQCCIVIGSKAFLFGGTSPQLELMEGTEMDLRDLSDMHVLDFDPSLRTLCMLSVIQYELDQSHLPQDVRWELEAMTLDNKVSRPPNSKLG